MAEVCRPVFTPGDTGVMITFRRISEGQDRLVMQQLRERFNADPNCIAGKVLLTLGQYDVVSIEEYTELGSFRAAALTASPFPHVYNTNSHACFTWARTSAGKLTRPLAELNGALLGLCFIKVNPQHLHCFGIHAECAIIREIRARVEEACGPQAATINPANPIPQYQLSFLGCLGWAEIVLLISTNDTKTLHVIGSIVRDSPCPLNPNGHPGVLTSFTVLGVEEAQYLVAEELLAQTDLAVSITTRGGSKALIRQDIRDRLPHTQWFSVLGKVDFYGFRFTGNTPAANERPIGQLLELRRDAGVLDTMSLPMFDMSAPVNLGDSYKMTREISPAIHRAEEHYQRLDSIIRRLEEDAASGQAADGHTRQMAAVLMVQQALCQYITCAYDPLISDSVRDIHANLFYICELAYDWLDHPTPDITALDIIYTASQTVLIALKQRYAGTYDTICNVNDINTSGMAVGVHRLIGASSSIIASLLKRYDAGRAWKGFVTYGRSLNPFRDHYGTFNFPADTAFDLLNLERLWYLHEVGHEYASRINDDIAMAVNDKQTLLTGSDGVAEEPTHPDEEEANDEAKDMQREIIADLFCFIIGFSSDSARYMQTLKDYFNQVGTFGEHAMPRLRLRHLLRLLAIQYVQMANYTSREEYVSGEVDRLLTTLDYYGYHITLPSHPSMALDQFFGGNGEFNKNVSTWMRQNVPPSGSSEIDIFLTQFIDDLHWQRERELMYWGQLVQYWKRGSLPTL